MGYNAYVLDGDCVRNGLNSDPRFDVLSRRESIRSAGEVAAILADAGVIVVAAFISPYRRDRDNAREAIGPNRFVETYLDVPLHICEQRDPKGLYKKARAGQISNFTGISDPYEPPETADIVLKTAEEPPFGCARRIVEYMVTARLLPTPNQNMRRPAFLPTL